MPYAVPTFNLSVNIWWVDPPGGPPDVVTVGNLAFGRRVAEGHISPPTTGGTLLLPLLLLPAHTDVRAKAKTVGAGSCEVPAGSGRLYHVLDVEDIGKGFSNEHRAALLQAILGSWGTPYP